MKKIYFWKILLLLCLFANGAFANANNGQVDELLRKAADHNTPFQEADSLFAQAATLSPQSASLYEAWGLLYEGQNRFAEAEEKYKQYQQLEPQSYIPWARMGAMEQKQNNYQQSNDYFAKAKAMHITVGMLDLRCYNYMQLQQWQEAVTECTEAIALDQERFQKSDDYAYNQRVQAYQAMGREDLANQDQVTIRKNWQKNNGDKKQMGMWLIAAIIVSVLSMPLKSVMLNLYVYNNKRPVLYSSAWVYLCFVPLLAAVAFFVPDLDSNTGFAVIALCVLLGWLVIGSYSTFGIDGHDFQELFFSVLKELNYAWEENNPMAQMSSMHLVVIQLPEVNLKISVYTGTGRFATLRIKPQSHDGNAQEAQQRIIDAIEKHFSEDVFRVQYDVRGLLRLLPAVGFLGFAFYMMHTLGML